MLDAVLGPACWNMDSQVEVVIGIGNNPFLEVVLLKLLEGENIEDIHKVVENNI